MRDCGLIAISTPLGPDNFISLLIELKEDDGSDFYNVLCLTSICDACMLKPTYAEKSACTHKWLPSWKSHSKQSRNHKVGMVTGSVETTAQEDCGLIIPGAGGLLFNQESLARDFQFKDKNRMFDIASEKYIPNRIYVACDPNADGSSNTTVCSCFWAEPENPKNIISRDASGKIQTERGFVMPYPRLVFLGMDVSNTKSSEEKDTLVLQHIEKIRTMCNYKYARIPIIFIPELGSGSFTTRCEEIVRNVASVETLRENGGQKYGVFKSDVVSAAYIDTWKSLSGTGRIKFHSDFFTLSEQYAEQKRRIYGGLTSDEQIVITDWREEMKRMQMLKRKITGKGTDGSRNDDMAIVGMMAAYWSKEVENIDAECYSEIRKKVWVPLDQRGIHLPNFSFNFQKRPEIFNIENKAKKESQDTLNLLPNNGQKMNCHKNGKKLSISQSKTIKENAHNRKIQRKQRGKSNNHKENFI